ncbi:MerR family transcriptional regulator [uncultured Ruthenibacterium sp.]|uniref:MerR family transcriptional regulator n=1 Tax=uncultured Ruthenibacterium sp. TaxID=1905347 RepID=UPI00349E6068
MLYSMKTVCQSTGMTYETLKFYCNQGLVPNVKRDARNRRIFDEQDIAWIQSLGCLKRCGLGIREMQHYVQLCLQGQSSIPERQKILAQKKDLLLKQLEQIESALNYIDEKQTFYDEVLTGKRPYRSNLTQTN